MQPPAVDQGLAHLGEGADLTGVKAGRLPCRTLDRLGEPLERFPIDDRADLELRVDRRAEVPAPRADDAILQATATMIGRLGPLRRRMLWSLLMMMAVSSSPVHTWRKSFSKPCGS